MCKGSVTGIYRTRRQNKASLNLSSIHLST